ncbi:MAG: arylesterase [Pseudomonadota bacterium]
MLFANIAFSVLVLLAISGGLAPMAAYGQSLLMLGDSITAGYGLAQPQSLPAQIQMRLNKRGWAVKVINGGVSGDTSRGGLARLDWMLESEGDIKVVLVALGGNDGLRAFPVEETYQNLDAILTRLNQSGITPVLAGMLAPPNLGRDYGKGFNQLFPELARHHNVLFYPFLLDQVAGEVALNQSDGIHPNAEGTQIIADRLVDILERALQQSGLSNG